MDNDFLIIPTLVQNDNDYHYEIFAVPIEELGRSTGLILKPKVIINCRNVRWKVCVVGFTVYLFSKDTSVGTFSLSTLLRSEEEEVVLKEEMIRYISPMKYRKLSVEAVPTPGGKVLVFSRSIERGSSFELYNPYTESWEDVPQIEPHLLRSFKEIDSYTFINNYTFVVQSPHGKPYHLILEEIPIYRRWQDPGVWFGAFPFKGFSRGILGGGYELCLSRNAVWDIKNAGGVYKALSSFPVSAFHPSFKSKSRMLISRGRWSHCYVLEIAKESGQCYLAIEEYRLDLVEYFKKKKSLEEEYFEDLERVDNGSWEHTRLVNRMKVTSPELEWFLLRSSTFLLHPGRSSKIRLDDGTTFSI